MNLVYLSSAYFLFGLLKWKIIIQQKRKKQPAELHRMQQQQQRPPPQAYKQNRNFQGPPFSLGTYFFLRIFHSKPNKRRRKKSNFDDANRISYCVYRSWHLFGAYKNNRIILCQSILLILFRYCLSVFSYSLLFFSLAIKRFCLIYTYISHSEYVDRYTHLRVYAVESLRIVDTLDFLFFHQIR